MMGGPENNGRGPKITRCPYKITQEVQSTGGRGGGVQLKDEGGVPNNGVPNNGQNNEVGRFIMIWGGGRGGCPADLLPL